MDLTSVLAALENLLLERLPDGRFVRRGAPPPWCTALGQPALLSPEPFVLEDVFPFLGAFLPDAERSWNEPSAVRDWSGFWTEVSRAGEAMHLLAVAFRVGEHRLLIVGRRERPFAQQEILLQRARELRMTHQSLLREIERKDILIHAIVHDLAAPLHSILGALSLLRELPLGEPAGKWTQIALEAATRQRQLIGDILDAFTAEYSGLVSPPDPALAPDLAEAIQEVVTEAAPTARSHGMSIRSQVGKGPWRVLAERGRLIRVLANLVDNALRYSPPGGTVTLSAERENHSIRANVDDEGPGVPPEQIPHLFERFGGHLGHVSGTGLGLYFCRITVEQWGGGIGYERRAGGGSRFWIRLVDALTRKRYG